MSKASMVMFFVVALAVVALGHAYIWLRLVRQPAWPAPWQTVGTVLVVGLGLLMVVALPLARALPRAWATPLAALAFTWMGMGFLLTVAFLLVDLVRLVSAAATSLWAFLGSRPSAEPDPGRRLFLAQGVTSAAALLAASAGGIGLRGGLGEVGVKEVPVRLGRLPKELSGLTIVQLTDIHVGPLIGRRFVAQVVEKTNALRPDVIAITGDLVDGSVRELADHVAPLAELRARYGVYFVTGNHEYYSGVEAWLEHLRRMGIRVLRNERVRIGDAASIDLAGIDDAFSHRYGHGHGPDLDRAVAGRDPERELVLLAHQPSAIHDAARLGVGLQLSGHTHGGQIWPFGMLVPLAQPYVAGLHRHGDFTQIYVSQGTGFWGPPMRLGAPAEITKVVLI